MGARPGDPSGRHRVTFTAEGEGGGAWHVVRVAARWELTPALPPRPAACQARTTVDGALKLYARDPSAPPLAWQGDRELTGGYVHIVDRFAPQSGQVDDWGHAI